MLKWNLIFCISASSLFDILGPLGLLVWRSTLRVGPNLPHSSVMVDRPPLVVSQSVDVGVEDDLLVE